MNNKEGGKKTALKRQAKSPNKKRRYRLTEEEEAMILQARRERTQFENHCEAQGIDPKDVHSYWDKSSKKYSIYLQPSKMTYAKVREDIIEDMKSHAPSYKKIKRDKIKHPCCLVIDPADVHIGKYGSAEEVYNHTCTEKSVKRVLEGVEGILAKAKGRKIDRIIYVGGNDKLHTDNPFNTTTSGTRQDHDGMWYESFKAAKDLDVKCIEMCMQVADVHYMHNLSNHDYLTGWMLSDTISSWFHNSSNITFDVAPTHRKYIQYGVSLIGTTHGDGAKEADLPDLMKTEARKAWAESKFGYWYVHHIHHKDRKGRRGKQTVKMEKDYGDVTVINSTKKLQPKDYVNVEYIRTQSGTDSWHHRNGYEYSPQAIEGFIHEFGNGQTDRITHFF